ncbi:MAG TPA: hypothetical protein VF755_19595 [Catenuloplanes sp.]
MSHLRVGDESLHYSDGSHRWVCRDPEQDPTAWTARIREHLLAHHAHPYAGRNPARSREVDRPAP